MVFDDSSRSGFCTLFGFEGPTFKPVSIKEKRKMKYASCKSRR